LNELGVSERDLRDERGDDGKAGDYYKAPRPTQE
jgi:hypothetical protein